MDKTVGAGWEVCMSRHIKTEARRRVDQMKLKQVALVWRAQTIYESAHTVCMEKQAYEDEVENRQFYWDVLNVLDETKARLQAILDSQQPTGIRPNRTALDEVPGSAGSTANCSSDDECPEDYICAGSVCVYLLED
jgi:hypothetical protein